MNRVFLAILVVFFSVFSAVAHGDLHERISRVSEEIKADCDSAYLYFKRGKLYYQHNNFTSSLKDLKSSQKLGFSSNEQIFLLAKNYYRTNRFILSKKYIKKLLQLQPNNVNALKLLGQVYYSNKKFEKAALTFEKVISFSKETFPENYLDASRSWYSLKSKDGIKLAQSILLNGIEQFGNNIVLYKKLISNYRDIGDYNSAIKLQKKVIDFSHRKERGYLKLANLYILQKNHDEASIALKMAENSFNSLPYRIKVTSFMKDFYSELKLKQKILKKENL
jgi:tetratricopeptide (TPR) repeat protein